MSVAADPATVSSAQGSAPDAWRRAAPGECKHFNEVRTAFRCYKFDGLREVARIERHLSALSPKEKLLIEPIDAHVSRMKRAVMMNQEFLNLLLVHSDEMAPDRMDYIRATGNEASASDDGENADPCEGCESEAGEVDSHCYYHVKSQNMSKVHSTIKQFVRDWSDEGLWERRAAYDPLLSALQQYVPIKEGSGPPRVLCPGCGLARLPFEVVRRGYASQGNEYSYFMLLGSNFVLNRVLEPKSVAIAPYCMAASNRLRHRDSLLEVRIPDVHASASVDLDADFSMVAGEFVEVYAKQVGEWDAVLTSFFLDTAKNILLYIHTVARIIRPGGLWANVGPLLYHYSDNPDDLSIELSWEELRPVVAKYFVLQDERLQDCYYTTDRRSMMQVTYHALVFVAIRNNVEVDPDLIDKAPR